MKAGKDTAFTVELLGLFILLIMVITIISSVFVMSRAHSLQARQLTEAVILAENTAEAASAAPDNDSLLDVASKLRNCIGHNAADKQSSEDPGTVVVFAASIDANQGESVDTDFIVRVTRHYSGGTYAEDIIEVFEAGSYGSDDIGTTDPSEFTDPVYTLTAGTYFGSKATGEEGGES